MNINQEDCILPDQLLGMLEGEATSIGNSTDLEFTSVSPLKIVLDDHLSRKNDDHFQSKDTLQSLVQSCRRCGGLDKYAIQSPLDSVQCRHHQLLMSFDKNIDVENYYCSKFEFEQEKQHQVSFRGSEREASKHKTRIRWTDDLHKKFIECVDHLGGAKKATPKAILKLMNSNGLTIFQVKSHLQKYRVARLIEEAATEGNTDQLDTKTGMQIVEALRLQIDVQRSLYEQLESQKKLQMRIEEQAKQLQTLLQCQLNTN